MKSNMLNVLGTLLVAFSQWIQIILITRIIGIYEVGLYTYFLAILAPFVMFNRFSFSTLVPTQKKFNYGYGVFLKFRKILNYFILIILAVLSVFLSLDIYEYICFIIFILFKFYETKEEFIHTQNITESNIHVLAMSKIYKSILNLIFSIVVVLLFESLLILIFSLLLSQILVYYFYDIKYLEFNKYEYNHVKYIQLKNIFIIGVGLTLVTVISSLNANIPRYFIEHFHNIEQLGIYSTIMYFAVIINNIIIAVNQSVISKLVERASLKINLFYKSYMKLLFLYIILIIIMCLILIPFGTDLLVIIYGDQFTEYTFEVMLLAVHISLMTIYKVLEMALSIFNYYNSQVILQIFSIFFTIALSFLFIIPYGISGAFYVTIVTFLLIIAGQVIILIYHHNRIKKS